MDLGLLLAVFVLSQLLHFSIQERSQTNAAYCPENFDCGRFGLMKFPYTDSLHPACGLIMVNCSAKPFPKIALRNPAKRWFQAKSIGDFNIKVEFPNLQSLLDNGDCASFYYDSSLPNSPSISFTILNNITLFRCQNNPETPNPEIIDSLPGHGHYDECPNITIYFTYPNSHSPTPGSIPSSCTVVYLPMKTKKISQNNETDIPGTGVFLLLAAEFDLQWHLSDDCHDCPNKGGICRRDWFEGSLCADATNGLGTALDTGKKKSRIILGSVIGGAASIFTALVVFLIWHRKKRTKDFRSRHLSEPISKLDIEGSRVYFGVSVFSYSELEEATNSFDASKKLGDGGFGTVYYGKLRDGREVAVKRLYEHNFNRMEQFMNEIDIVTRLRHRNLATLYGCTSRRSHELLLVYEYVPNGTVADHLHGNRAKDKYLTWAQRMNIAIETADALAYLHASDTIHRDVTTNNILLDDSFCVKVADFGLSRLFPNHFTHVSTGPQGTPGYIDPEYNQCFHLTNKSDVYSFGIVLVELISSMRAVDRRRSCDDINLANLAMNRIQRCAFDELIDPSLGYKSDTAVMRMTTSVAMLAFRCLQGKKEMRPTMEEVLETLKEIWNYKEISVENRNDSNENVNETVNPGIPLSPELEDRALLKNVVKFPKATNSVANVCVGRSAPAASTH